MKRLSLLILVCASIGADVLAQCPVTAKTWRDSVWAPGTTVNVWVAPEVIHGLDYMRQAAANWNNSDAASMMRVRIQFTSTETNANVRVVQELPPDGSAGAWHTYPAPGGVTGGTILINPGRTGALAIGQTFAHELGHPFGLHDCSFCPTGSSVMNMPDGLNDTSRGTLGPTTCDNTVIRNQWSAEFEEPNDPCSDFCELIEGGGGDDPELESSMNTACSCPDPDEGVFCPNCSPILVDVDGDGIDLTAAAAGVLFRLNPAFISRLGWTQAGDDDAWLALDRDCDGVIRDGSELFGNFTAQPATDTPHGYRALAVFDQPDGGGNGDNRITAADGIFGALRLWTDRNHDGRSSPDELRSLAEAGVESIDLDWRSAAKHDQHGNVFRYRAKVTTDGRERWSYDVFLANLP